MIGPKRTVRIRIDHLLVDGPVDREALEQELARSLATRAPGSLPAGRLHVARRDAGTVEAGPAAGPEPFGRAIAARIAGAIRR